MDFQTYRTNALRFLDRCGVSDGIANEAAWEQAGCPSVFSPQGAAFVKPPSARRVVTQTLAERMARNDWAFASTPGGGESLEGGHSAVEALHLLGALACLSDYHKRAWVDYFNQYQDRSHRLAQLRAASLASHAFALALAPEA